LRALARAADSGTLAIPLPMISDLSEIRRTRTLLEEACGGACAIPLGIMIETPAAALMAADLAAAADFFSVGTNDLVQYTLAVDRLDERLGNLYSPFHPAVLRLLRTVRQATPPGVRVAVCGEMAADWRASAIFTGLGIGELSMEASRIPEVKFAIRSLRRADAAAFMPELLASAAAREVEER
jgi:phosphoenolpyruvate-protein phosphotransferase (PTS system enzyme I)